MAFVIPTKESFREMYHQCCAVGYRPAAERFCRCGGADQRIDFGRRLRHRRECRILPRVGRPLPASIFWRNRSSAKQKATERKIKATFQVQDALALADLRQQFDSAIDSGLFHTFSDEQRPKYVAGLAQVLKPGGNLFLMCFSDKEPGDIGPRRVSQAELRSAFSKGWKIESIKETHFEITKELPPNMKFSPGGPFAWFAVIERQP